MTGAATDIGVGSDGSIWILGTDRQAKGYGIYRWESNNWVKANGDGEVITVDRDGNPWVINSDSQIFQRSDDSSNSGDLGTSFGSWQQKDGMATDIAIGANNDVWIIGTDRQTDGYSIFKWENNNWTKVEGAAEVIAVDRNGIPWVINSNKNIFTR